MPSLPLKREIYKYIIGIDGDTGSIFHKYDSIVRQAQVLCLLEEKIKVCSYLAL